MFGADCPPQKHVFRCPKRRHFTSNMGGQTSEQDREPDGRGEDERKTWCDSPLQSTVHRVSGESAAHINVSGPNTRKDTA